MDKPIYIVFPILVLLLCIYGFLSELLTRRLQRGGVETTARVVSVDRAIAFGLRNFLATLSKKTEKERQFGCDYILTVRFTTQDGVETTVQTAVPARMKIMGGERVPYFMAGDSIPIRYSPHNPKRLVVTADEVLRRQSAVWKLAAWGFCVVLMLSIVAAIFIM